MASTSKDKFKKIKNEEDASGVSSGYYFYKNLGLTKRECTKYHDWRVKECILLTLVCFKVNLISVSWYTWWVDFDATAQISKSMHGYLNSQKSNDTERLI